MDVNSPTLMLARAPEMFDRLKLFCAATVPLAEAELALLDTAFELRVLTRKAMLLEDGGVCPFIGFLAEGTIRYFHVKDGDEKTCDIAFENAWVTDFQSFTQGTPGKMNLQALEDTTVLLITRERLQALYAQCGAYETFGRLMAERVAQRATDIAMSLSSEKPEERFRHLLHNHPDLFQRVPQKYIANFLGISPESLSRIRRRIATRERS